MRPLLPVLVVAATPACNALFGVNEMTYEPGAAEGGIADATPSADGGDATVVIDALAPDAPPKSTAPSCASQTTGESDCGAAHESCCTSLYAAPGTYSRTYTNDGTGPAGQSDEATVSGLYFDKYEVTVARFREYVKYLTGPTGAAPADGSGKHTHLHGGSGLATASGFEHGWDASAWSTSIATRAPATSTWNSNLACDPNYATWTLAAGGNEDKPINCVSWTEAYAFCIWDSGFLPSEAEWELAAAGGAEQLEYPWGNAAPATGNAYAIYGCNWPGDAGSCAGAQNVAPVGSAGQGGGKWGQLDLAGNVWEWALDWYGNYTSPCTDCASLDTGSQRTFRGGGFNRDTSTLAPAARSEEAPSLRGYGVGIRCARSP